MASRGKRHNNGEENRKSRHRLRYYDNSGYYGNQPVDYRPSLRYHDNNRYQVGRYKANGVAVELQDNEAGSGECSYRRAVIITVIVFVVLIVACTAVGIFFAVKNGDSGNNRASGQVTTEVSFDGDVVLLAEEWNEDLNNQESPTYRQFEETFITDMDDLFKENTTTTDSYSHTAVTEFRPGSVRVIFKIVFIVPIITDITETDDVITVDKITVILKTSIKFDKNRIKIKKTSSIPVSTDSTSSIQATTSTSTSTPSTTSTSSSTVSTTSTTTSTPSSSSPSSASSTVTTTTTRTSTSTSPSISTTSSPTTSSSLPTSSSTSKATSETTMASTISATESRSSESVTVRSSTSTTESGATGCSEGEFKCLIYEECIDETRHCDGIEHCKDKSDEWYECGLTPRPWLPTDLEVKLLDGEQESITKGRVEVRRRGKDEEFGTVCGEGWSTEDATVVCRMLNPEFAETAYAYSTAIFGEGTGPILMSRVNCHGNESNLGDCMSRGFGYGLVHCSHAQDAGVSCDGAQVPTSPLPVFPGPDSDARLIRGEDCLEGLLQVYHDEEWRFVCADLFGNAEATVACRTLGYNAGVGYVFFTSEFGYGDGLYWLDDVNCKGDESHIFNCTANHWGENDCTVTEAVGIKCAGDRELDCGIQEPCVSSINCAFETDDCCYDFIRPDKEGEGTTTWVRYTAEQIGQVDHTQKKSQGKIVYYRNIYGGQNDFAYLELPQITLEDQPQKLEFFYLIQSYGSNFLSIELETDVTMVTVWQSPNVPKEMEGRWIYGCWNVHQRELFENATLRFIGRRGPLATRVIALDDISLSEGFCEGISSKRCDFDEFGECNARIVCDDCEQDYRWRWTSDELDSDKREWNKGYYMLADASHGIEGDTARMEFVVTENWKDKQGLKFKYKFIGQDNDRENGGLKVMVNSGDSGTLWQSESTVERDVWHIDCTDIPNVNDNLKITFEAARGSGIFDDIALDYVEIIGYCPYPGSCDFEEEDCGYTVDAFDSELFTWAINGNEDADLVKTPMTDNSMQLYDTGAQYGSWAKLVSPFFNITGGPYKLTFRISKMGPGTFQVYITSDDVKHHLGMDMSPVTGHTDGPEAVCINLGDLVVENAQLVFEATKGSDWNTKLYANRDFVSIDDIEIATGECIVPSSCTFEDDHRLCSYTNIDDDSETSVCETEYIWRRRGGKYDDVSIEDHTLGDKTGHYLAASTAYGDLDSTATVLFRMVNLRQEQDMHVMMFYTILGDIEEKSSLRLIAGQTEVDLTENDSTSNGWKPVCAHVFAEANETVELNVTANNIDALIDDVSLKPGNCQEESVNCSFEHPFMCGYTVKFGGRHRENFVRFSKSGKSLMSPSFKLEEDSSVCIAIDAQISVPNTPAESPYFEISLYNEIDESSLRLRYNHPPVTYNMWRLQYFQTAMPAAKYHLTVTANLGDNEHIDIKSIHLSQNECPSLDCPSGDIPCSGEGYKLCMPVIDACQQQDVCSSTTAAECLPTSDCNFDENFSCGWMLHGAEVKDSSLVLGGRTFTYAETPVMYVTKQSCLSFTLQREFNDNLLRIIRNSSNSLEEVENFSLVKAQGRIQELKVELPLGKYSLIFEARHDGTGDAFLHIDDVSVSDGTCNYSECAGNSCSFVNDHGQTKSICFHENDVFCDKYVDCPSGTDENNCYYSFDCDFNADICGYDVSEGLLRVKTPYRMHDTGVTIRSEDGSRNDFVLIYDSTRYEQSAFTSGPLVLSSETCEIEFDVACHVDPSVNASESIAHLVINITDEYRRSYFYKVNIDVSSEWSKLSVPIEEILADSDVWTGRFVPTFQFSGTGVVIAIDNIQIVGCFANQNTTATLSTASQPSDTDTDLPADFPDVVITEDLIEAQILDNLELSCSINNQADYMSTLYWYKDDVQISRDSEIVNQEYIKLFGYGNVEIEKYDVSTEAGDTQSTDTYMLTINRMTNEDTALFTCKLFANGHSKGDSVHVSVNSDVHAQTDDNCYKNTMPTCHDLGFQKVLTPGPFGIYDISEASQRLQGVFGNSDLYEAMSDQCTSSVLLLQCGMYSPACLDGEEVPVCREHCEDIVNTCMLEDTHGDLFASLQFSCKFLPSASDFPACVPVFKGCGLTYTSPSGRIMTENYPHSYPLDAECAWYVVVDPYHYIEFEVTGYNVGDNTGSDNLCGLYVYDETSKNILANVACGEVLTPFSSIGNNVSLRFTSDLVSTGRGFSLKYKQIPVNACLSFSGDNDLSLISTSLSEEQCTTFKVYLEDERDTLIIKVSFLAKGCLRFSNDIEDGIDEQICDVTTAKEYRTKQYMNIHVDSREVMYEISIYKVIYERSVSSVALDENGRLEITSEGAIGGFCGALQYQTADVLCKSIGLGWPAEGPFDSRSPDELPTLVSSITCTGDEEDITQCQFSFDAFSDYYCYILQLFGLIQTVTCSPRSVSCDFRQSTCGYLLDSNIQMHRLVGLYLSYPSPGSSEMASPEFLYSEGVNLHFEYSIRRAVGEKLSIHLVDNSKNSNVLLWEWSDFAAYGKFKGCVRLPSPVSTGETYQIVVKYSSGELIWEDSSVQYTGIQSLSLSFDKCEDETGFLCQFENIEACASFINFENLACYRNHSGIKPIVITSGSTFSRGESWVIYDHTYKSSDGHFLLIDEGTVIPLLDTSKISDGNRYFRLHYAIDSGIYDSENMTMTLEVGDVEIYKAEEFARGWLEACVDMSDIEPQHLVLIFGDSQFHQNGVSERSTASLAIDDITFSPLPCTYYMNCNFEDDCSLRYHSLSNDDTKADWIKEMSPSDFAHKNGYYMKADFNSTAVEGDISILRSDHLLVADNIQCVQFQYSISGTDNPGSLKVHLHAMNESRDIFVANGNQGDDWFTFQAPIDKDVLYIKFIATKGNGRGTILLDNVEFTSEPCISGLHDVEYCSSDNPVLCGIKSFASSSWKRGSASILQEGVNYDADINENGYFYYIKPGELAFDDQENYITFDVSATSQMSVQFSYITIGATSSSFYIEINEQQETVPFDIEGHWVVSGCYELPDDYEGKIVIGIGNDVTETEFIAIDNVQVVETTQCNGPSLSCDFTTGDTCMYRSLGNTWKLAEALLSTGSGTVKSPTVLLSKPYCFRFLYSVMTVDSFDEQSTLHLYRNGEELWKTNGKMWPENNTVQVTLEAAVTDLYFQSEGKGLYKLFETNIVEGICKDIADCTEFRCGDRCISLDRKCDRTVDCVDGGDESETLCGFKLLTDFITATDLKSTGFQTSASSYVAWNLESDTTVVINGTEKLINGQSLVTRFRTLVARPSTLESFEYHLEEDSCLQINYFGDVAYGKLQLSYKGNASKDTEIAFNVKAGRDVQHISIPVVSGDVRVLLYVYMFEIRPGLDDDFPESSVFVAEQILMHAGKSCDELTVECPNGMEYICLDKRSCYTEDEKCDMVAQCFDESDETEDCGYNMVCNFEHPNSCGYSNISPRRIYIDYRWSAAFTQTVWERIASSSITRPTFDHTFQISGEGHFITSKNFEGLLDKTRYVDIETMQSPYQVFDEDGCVTFWYYLNSTQHQPKTTSAQIFVYIQYEDSEEKILLWYDHINRQFSWVHGGVPVSGNRAASLIVTAKTSIPFDGFTGVVSFDDVDYSVGDCDVTKIECDVNMHNCMEDDICIPDSFVCDGEADCEDGSDELLCDRPDGSLKLIGGDGTYGKLAYFHNGAWRPVCYPDTDDELEIINTAHDVCRELKFIGNSDLFAYKHWEKYTAVNIQLSCSVDGDCRVNTSAACEQYAYIRCSDEVCFTDEVVCPGTRSACNPRSYFCDGQQDCPENTDEKECYCYEDDKKCTRIQEECKDRTCETCEERGMFRCFDHECVPLKQRCDGKRDCGDASDEYKCVQIGDNSEVSVFMNTTLTREMVCVDGIRAVEADTFCQMAGQGEVAEISSGYERTKHGVNPITYEPMENCFPLTLKCHMPECGTTSTQDDFIQPFVINGRDASIEEWPWYGFLSTNGIFTCGLSLIDPLWAITASHCFGGNPNVIYTATFGADSLDSDSEWRQNIPIEETFEYGYISTYWLVHDITLLKLKYPALINNFTRPVCVPSVTSLDDVRAQGIFAECFAIGLGTSEKLFADPTSGDILPDVLQKKQVQILTKEHCKESWTTQSRYPDAFPENVVCIGTEAPSSPSCFGDSGGPLVCKANSGRWELFGLVSFGYGSCYHDLIPTVLTSVADYREWIEDATGLKLGN